MTSCCAADRAILRGVCIRRIRRWRVFASVPSFRKHAASAALIPVNTRVFNGFILRRMHPALHASGRISGRGGAGRVYPPRTGATPRATLSARNPEQERRPWRSTNNNGRCCNSG
ncbi:hypothetical protein EMIT0111MI5_10495 [Burkholderia sp. IT-111MI5]